MKKLFLLRHAHSTQSLPDFDRVLNMEGIIKAQTLSKILAPYSNDLDLVLCSSSMRTRQTIINALPDHPIHYSIDYYNSSVEQLMKQLQAIDDRHTNILLVSHNSAISELASLLCSDDIIFAPGGLALLDANIKSWRQLIDSTCELTSFWK